MAATEGDAVSGDVVGKPLGWWVSVGGYLLEARKRARAAILDMEVFVSRSGHMGRKIMADALLSQLQDVLVGLEAVEAVTAASLPKSTTILKSVNGSTFMTVEDAREFLDALTKLISVVSDASFANNNVLEASSRMDDIKNFQKRKLADLQRFLTTVCTADASADPAQPTKRPRTDDAADADVCSQVKWARDSVNAQLNKAVTETANCMAPQLQAVLRVLPMSNPEAVEACVQAIKGALKANDSGGGFIPTATRVELMTAMALAFDKVCDGVNTGASGPPGV
jgi:hypothetical protein